MAAIQTLLGPNGLIHSTEDEMGNVNVLWGGTLYISFNRDDLFSTLIGIALLDSINVLQKTICEIFKVSRNTITKVSRIYQEQGVAGLMDYHHGAPGVEEELKAFVIKTYIELDKCRGYQKMILEAVEAKAEAGEFRKGISRTTLHNIIRAYEKRQEEQKNRIIEERNTAETADGKDNLEAKGKENESIDGTGNGGELEFGEKLIEGEERCVDHGGCSFVVPLLDAYGIAEYIPTGDDDEYSFSNTELAMSYAILNAGEVAKVEQDFKLLPRHEMGGMIGRKKLPSLSLYRNRIPQVVDRMDMREVIVQTSAKMRERLGFTDVLYIDGHFMAYHGKSQTLHGYNPQKRLAMHGREYFFVHDRAGLPVYATISDGYRKSKHYIEDVDEKLRRIYGAGKKELLEVFDRGGYSKEFCVRISDTICFLCWRSDAKRVPTEAQDAEWMEVLIEHQGNDYGASKRRSVFAWEQEAVFEWEGEQARFREIWIRKGKKTSPALTNDMQTSLGELVGHMTRRWGAQENMFKELKEHGIDRIHSYRKEAYTESFLYERGLEEQGQGIVREIDNPERKAVSKKIAELRVNKRKMCEQIVEKGKAGDSKQLTVLKRKYAGVERRIAAQMETRDAMPRKVNLFDWIRKQGVVRLSDEKKLFFDWLKMNAIWAKREMIEMVKPIYGDLRDVNKFVRSILKSRTYVKRLGENLFVSFPPQQSKKGNEALEMLCEALTINGNLNSGMHIKRIVFNVRQKH